MIQKSKSVDKNKAACRYPIKLNKIQHEQLMEWSDSLRWLWNHTLSMIKSFRESKITYFYMGMQQLDLETHKYTWINKHGTNKDLTAIRRDDIKQKNIPNMVQQNMLIDLDNALKRYLFKDKVLIAERNRRYNEAKTPKAKASAINYGFPKFKNRFKDIISLQFNNNTFKIINIENKYYIKLPKIDNPIRILTDRGLPDQIIRCTLSYDPIKDMWFISLVYVIEYIKKDFLNKDVLGVDMGDRISCYTSDNNQYNINKEEIIRLELKKKKLQKILAKKIYGSKRYHYLNRKIILIDRKMANIRRYFQDKTTKILSDDYPIIGLEDLKVSNMIKSAKGTGVNVQQKTNLNHLISRQGWYGFRSKLIYKCKKNGGKVILVNPAYTSITCNKCGNINKFNRQSGDFKCIQCGFESDADYNASNNIRERAIEQLTNYDLTNYNLSDNIKTENKLLVDL